MAKRLKLGITSFSTRKFSLTETIAIVNQLGVGHVSLKSFHLPLDASKDKILAAAKEVADGGLELMGCGVVYMPNAPDFLRSVFEYAKTAGMEVITASPDHDALPTCNELVQEYDIKIAIHNHGPGDEKYPLATDAYALVKDLDPRMGVCPDIGHITRINHDPIAEIKAVADRMHDFHIKDVSGRTPENKTCEIGRGVIDIAEVLRTLIGLDYDGHVALEFEKDPEAPVVGMAESLGYVKGMLALL
jgi:inosose dehydratase